MIELYGIELDQLPDRREVRWLIGEEFYLSWRRKHRNVGEERVARASLGGLLLLKYANQKGKLLYEKNGRPYFENSDIDFNITHTDRYVFCAIETPEPSCDRATGLACRVGLDAEEFTRITHLRICPLAERWFTATELDRFLAQPTDDTFLRIWTHKEALVKWMGDGLKSMRSVDTTTAEAERGVVFQEYRLGNTVLVLCHRKGTAAPDEVTMLTDAIYRQKNMLV